MSLHIQVLEEANHSFLEAGVGLEGCHTPERLPPTLAMTRGMTRDMIKGMECTIRGWEAMTRVTQTLGRGMGGTAMLEQTLLA